MPEKEIKSINGVSLKDEKARELARELNDKKVDKIEGKGLSSNDYTSVDKAKLGTIEEAAQVNIIEHILINGAESSIDAKSVNINIPAKTSDLINDIAYTTSEEVSRSLDTKVDKVVGKQLSTNDFTNDYRDKLDNLDNKIHSYVITEAENAINKIIEAQGNRTFTFACITDLHYGNGGYTNGIMNACESLKYIDSRIKLDAVAVLGDYTDGYPENGYDNAIGDFRTVNAMLSNLRFTPNLRLCGNHDYYKNHTAITHRHIQAYSDNVIWGNRKSGYFYRDFDDYKLRIICVNTVENGNDLLRVSNSQYKWFVDSLDLSSKDNASEWQILILSHHPLDWYVESEYLFAYILNAYQKGISWNGNAVSCDFTGKNQAKLIGNIHGHIHNLLIDYLHFGNVSGGDKSTVWRISTPEACIDRANQYEGAWKEETTHSKTVNTAKDTSFCVYCIDLDTCTIKAICYGAGYDRTLTYLGEPVSITNQIPLSIDTDGSPYNGGLGYKEGYRLNSSGIEAECPGLYVTGFIPCKLGDIIRLKNVELYSLSSHTNAGQMYFSTYDENKFKLTSGIISYLSDDNDALVYENDDINVRKVIQINTANAISDDGAVDWRDENMAYFRISCVGISKNSIITVNEDIN